MFATGNPGKCTCTQYGCTCTQVRWADLEAAKEEQRKREIGFCIGSSWTKVSEEEADAILKGAEPQKLV